VSRAAPGEARLTARGGAQACTAPGAAHRRRHLSNAIARRGFPGLNFPLVQTIKRNELADLGEAHLAKARAAMEALAASLPPEELNRVGFRLYERFPPDVPEGAAGWGAKGELRVNRIVGAAG
jgi:hypothetical protein